MKSRITFQVCLLVAVAFMMTGCGSSVDDTLAPVSGNVTLGGKPIANAQVVFAPKSVDGNENPGPYSRALTDENGHFELKTRYGDNGAVIGKHTVSFEYQNVENMGELKTELAEAESEKDAAEIQARIDKYLNDRKTKSPPPKIPSWAYDGFEYEVPAEGLENVDFDLSKQL